jgi:flagellar biosynthetic protein FlhB
MSEDRTQRPSKRRRQLAREQGQVAHSPELTAAAGWLVGLVLLGFWGGELAQNLVGLAHGSLAGRPVVWIDPTGLVAHARGQVMAVAGPLGVILGGVLAGALAAHQMQVRGLWAPALVAPDPARLWALGREGVLAARLERAAWVVIKAIVLVAASVWAVRAQWAELQHLSELEASALAGAAGLTVLQPARVLGIIMLGLGLVDFGLRYLRFEATLRTTPQEQREDQRVMESDPSLRAKRRRLAQAWRGEAPELLTGASLIVNGTGGLTVVLIGGPPPRRVSVRAVAQGNTGLQLRRTGAAARLPHVDAPGLARLVAREATSGSSLPLALPAGLTAEVAALWPSE